MRDSMMVRAVGIAQRLLLWAVLASILGWIIPFAFLVTIPFQLYCVYKLAKALELGTGALILYLTAMFIPLVSLICLLVLNSKATSVLRDAGIKVGLMGAKPSELPSSDGE